MALGYEAGMSETENGSDGDAARPKGCLGCDWYDTLDHGNIKKEPKSPAMGWATLLFGISIKPTRIDYRCYRCGAKVGSTSDPALLKQEL